MKPVSILLLLGIWYNPACGQETRSDLFLCEGCEAIYEHAFDTLTWYTTVAPDDEPGEMLVMQGTVFQPDGTTPAPDVILYVYHTNAGGIYPKRGNETGWARRHGYLRGWMKTDARGRYQFQTIRPEAYPNGREPAHIHITLKEPGRQEYWIDEFVFEGDPYLTSDHRGRLQNRGGSGIIRLKQDENNQWQGQRKIILER